MDFFVQWIVVVVFFFATIVVVIFIVQTIIRNTITIKGEFINVDDVSMLLQI